MRQGRPPAAGRLRGGGIRGRRRMELSGVGGFVSHIRFFTGVSPYALLEGGCPIGHWGQATRRAGRCWMSGAFPGARGSAGSVSSVGSFSRRSFPNESPDGPHRGPPTIPRVPVQTPPCSLTSRVIGLCGVWGDQGVAISRQPSEIAAGGTRPKSRSFLTGKPVCPCHTRVPHSMAALRLAMPPGQTRSAGLTG